MPTPPLSDEVLAATVETYRANGGNQVQTADALGLSRGGLQTRLRIAARRGLLGTEPVMPGYYISQTTTTPNGGKFIQQKPEPGEEFTVPAGHIVKGVSAYLDEDGRVRAQWVKTREGEFSPEALAEILQRAFDDVEPARPVPLPVRSNADLLTLIPCNDWHINLLVWGREASENWDLSLAEQIIGQGIDDAIDRSPPSAVAVVLGGGDLLHSDNNENRTAKSGNALDADGRYQKGLEVALRLKVRTIDRALEKADAVIVRVLPGNHDEYASIAVAYYLLAYYRNEPRVTVDVDPSLFWWFTWGAVMLGATHGHTVKADQMAQIMAHRRAEDWGRTKFRYVHSFHLHHKRQFSTEGGGVITEVHQAPVPQDAWHFGSGFLSGRSLQTITYHNSFGEVSRVRVAILDAAEAA
jgi:hypothetical protein